MAKKTYVLDTSVCLTDSESVHHFGNNDIVLPLKVLEELDKHKKRQDGVGTNARRIIRELDDLRSRGSLQAGVRIAKGKGILTVRGTSVEGEGKFSPDLDPTIADHIIITTAISEDLGNGSRKTILVSRDINMRVICDSIGLASEDYTKAKVIKSQSELYSGFTSVLVDDQFVDQFYDGKKVFLDPQESEKLHTNQYLMLVSNSNDKKTALTRFVNDKRPLAKVPTRKDGVWGVKPRNKEQAFGLDLLLDPSVSVVTLVGKAGSGKTLCAVAAGLQQVLEAKNTTGVSLYKKLVVSRPIQPMGKDIGFLPGTMEDKMAPWLAPIQDNLKFLMGDQTTLGVYMEKGVIEMEALTYIRGRSIANAFIIIDEAQNLSVHEIKTILTRVGEGTKIVLTGDIEQIDNIYIDETSNGLVHAVQKFKDFDIAGHISLLKGERSKVATIAANIL
jgi:PhoH-like ATPase